MSAIKKFAGQTAIYGISTVVSRVLNFFLTPIYVASYAPRVYGVITVMYSWTSMLSAVLAFGMETTFFRYLKKYENDQQKVYGNSFLTILALSVVFLVFAGLFSEDIAIWMQQGEAYNPDYAIYLRYVIFILVADAIAVIPFASIRAKGRALRYSLIKLLNILTFVGFNLFFIFAIPVILTEQLPGANFFSSWYREGWVGYVFLSNLFASLITLLLLLPELRNVRFVFDKALQREMLAYSFPVLIANISFIVNENIDKIFLRQMLPPGIAEQDVGIYGACSKIAIFLSIFVQAFRLGAEPFFFSHSSEKNAGVTYARIMNFFVIAVCLIFIFLTANIELLKYFIRGKDEVQQALYWSGLDIVPVLLFGYISLGIYMNLSIWYKLSDQTRYGLYISGAGAILTIVLNVLFIPQYSYIASAWISFTAYTFMMILSYILGQKNYPIPYNLQKNMGYILAAMAVVFVSFVVFSRNLIVGNLLFFIFTIAAIYVERRELRALFRSRVS